jgi:hypothetical protein
LTKERTVKPLPIVVLLVWILGPLPVWAHGTGIHVLGTVAEITADHLSVRVPNGDTVTVTINATTRYRTKKGTTPKPQVGDRVVIEAAKDNDALTAVEVQFNPPPAAGASTKSPSAK